MQRVSEARVTVEGETVGAIAERVKAARSLASRDPLDEQHRVELSEGAKQLAAALEPGEKS